MLHIISPIKATRNVAYENTSEFSGYEYVNAQSVTIVDNEQLHH